jgi:hypothetical protein
MQSLSSRSGSCDYSEEQSDFGDASSPAERRQYFAELIAKANTVPLPEVMRKYGFLVDAYNRKIPCPFKFHQNGNERTASFWYYPDTNSFYCFGCKSSRSASDFVALYDGVSRSKAASKIIESFSSEVSDDWEVSFNSQEQQEMVIAFSNTIRSAIRDCPGKLADVEMITGAFDMITEKYPQLDLDGTKRLIAKMTEKLEATCRLS